MTTHDRTTNRTTNRHWVLRERPAGAVSPAHFERCEGPVPAPGDGEVLVRTRLVSIDPANRAWMFPSPTYKAPVSPGDTMHGFGLAEVVESRAPSFAPGDLVEGMTGWQDWAVLPAAELTRRAPGTPPEHAMGVLGITGLTAYFGLLEIGRVRAGETVVISAAAGAVGSVAVQIAKILGCRVVGIAGGPEKCAWLQRELGADAALDWKAGPLRKPMKAACPDGVDVYFDNTGGDALSAALAAMNLRGRIVCCGNLSQYNVEKPEPGPAAVPGLIVTKRIRMEGFIVMDHLAEREAAEATLREWLASGRLKAYQTIVEGFDQLPQALADLFGGANLGKSLVRL